MQREIKFRAWNGTKMTPALILNFENGEAEIEASRTAPASSGNTYVGYKWMPISELMEYTGLRDKNGMDIYEGDIVTIGGSNMPAVMRFLDGGFYAGHIDGGAEAYQMEVIGNIYENPELLISPKKEKSL